jgi:hypothetical protein
VLVFGTQQQTFLLILMEDKLKISLKGKNKFARNKRSSYLADPKGQVLRQIE